MSAGFNFNQINLSDQADISKVMENFEKIETNGITYTDAKQKATTIQDGIMSKEDKTKLDSVQSGAAPNNIDIVKFNNVTQTITENTLSLTESDPTVPNWAKQAYKPDYTWTEVKNKPIFVTQSVISNFWFGTSAQYDAIATKDNTTLYLIQEEAD